LEMACWDIVGKALDQPVYNLLGGRVHETLRSYTYLYPAPEDMPSPTGDESDAMAIAEAFGDAEMAPRRAAHYTAQGFTAIKFDPVMPMGAFDPRQLSLAALDNAELVIRNLREAVGGECDLLVGTHGQMTTSSAIRLARRLEPFDPLWFEEPVPPENTVEMARVARHTSIPVASG
ncbi:MAG: enolase C-terminal domain-like protein, partial [SAR202 cluster bacterium]|nr:enolase C-terminal domain-like protein [SAR202 cluster bacterium]